MASIIPDIDLLVPGLRHRGPTHSIILSTLVFLPVLMLLGKRSVPYFIALVQHFLIGDFIVGNIQLLWPITRQWYGTELMITSLSSILLELTFFIASTTTMFKTKEIRMFFKHHPANVLLSIPIFTVLLPAFLRFPMSVPPALIIPHLVYLVIFAMSTLIDLTHVLGKLLT